MKIYVAGKVTNKPDYKEVFEAAKQTLETAGHTVMVPSVLPDGFEHSEYMHVCYAMIDVCDSVYLLDNWRDSPGARMEHGYAFNHGKMIWHEDNSIAITDPDVLEAIRRG